MYYFEIKRKQVSTRYLEPIRSELNYLSIEDAKKDAEKELALRPTAEGYIVYTFQSVLEVEK